jgi:hypothetical protein
MHKTGQIILNASPLLAFAFDYFYNEPLPLIDNNDLSIQSPLSYAAGIG